MLCTTIQRAENKDLSTQLASQTQTRLTLSDKFDLSTKVSRALLLHCD